jgi:antitoxin ParD1/3/4
MPTRPVRFTDHQHLFVENLVAAGRYKNASEVLSAGLSPVEQESKEDELKLSALLGLASEAIAALDRGEGTALEGEQQLADFISRLGQRVANRADIRPGRE